MGRLRISRNQPCPCGSGKKYKRCCMGKLPEFLEEYYGLLRKEGILKDKIFSWTIKRFTREELADYAKEFCGKDLPEVEEEMRVFFLDWFLFGAVHKKENKRMLEVIRRELADSLDELELEIIDEWLNNTQTGFYEVEEINKKEYTTILKEIATGKVYRILDVKGSAHAVRGDILLGRVQRIFSAYYLSGAMRSIPRMVSGQFKKFVDERFENEKKADPGLGYEEFMNTRSEALFNFVPPPPIILSSSGEELRFCESTYSIHPEDGKEIVDWFAADDKRFLITEEEYGSGGMLECAEIGCIQGQEKSSKKGGLMMSSHWMGREGKGIPVDANIRIKDGKMILFSMSEKAFLKYKGLLEKHFGEHLSLEKEEITSAQEALEEKRDAPAEGGKETRETRELGREFLLKYYREWCDMKIPAFGNRTPRQVIKTEDGRKQLKEMLLDLENQQLHNKRNGLGYIPVVKAIRDELGFHEK